MSQAPIDPDRFAEHWSLNEDVLDRLAESGDRGDIPRLVDVSFRGARADLQRLADAAGDFGFSVRSLDDDEDGEPWLFLERIQPADREAIRLLTNTYLQIEDVFTVECDGWGCLAETGTD